MQHESTEQLHPGQTPQLVEAHVCRPISLPGWSPVVVDVDRSAEPGPGVVAVADALDDPTLVVRAQEGDLVALEALLRRHQRPMYRLAVGILGDPSDAEDAVQEAFVSAWRRLDGYRGEAAFSSWLYRIVTNRCLNMARQRQRHRAVTVDDMDTFAVPAGQAGPEATAQVQAERLALGKALMTLPAEQRACWVLREGDGLGYQDIAAIVGISPDAARGRIHRARQNLALALREWR